MKQFFFPAISDQLPCRFFFSKQTDVGSGLTIFKYIQKLNLRDVLILTSAENKPGKIEKWNKTRDCHPASGMDSSPFSIHLTWQLFFFRNHVREGGCQKFYPRPGLKLQKPCPDICGDADGGAPKWVLE